jgi:macrolide-specific efflux system membrane fusion protein
MKKNLFNLRNYILGHKIISLIGLIIIIAISYWIIKSFSNTATETSYITGQVKRETIIISVSGTGQVSALNQIDLKTKVSGDLTYLNVKVGQEVQKGAYLAQIDNGDASYELESAKIAYDKLIT